MPYLTAQTRDYTYTFRPQYGDVQVDWSAPAYLGRRAAVLFATSAARARDAIEAHAAAHQFDPAVTYGPGWQNAL